MIGLPHVDDSRRAETLPLTGGVECPADREECVCPSAVEAERPFDGVAAGRPQRAGTPGRTNGTLKVAVEVRRPPRQAQGP
jgi:hypothetical protein